MESQRDARLEAWGRDDFSVFKPKKVAEGESVEISMTTTREVMDGVTPFFREKPKDLAQRARFPTNRIQKFSREYHKSRPMMDMDSQSFMARLLQ